MNKHHLILGGARSGKSRFAESQALALSNTPHYIATAEALDEEMAIRIQHHKESRCEGWQLIEEPLALAEKIDELADKSVILIDCLTVWLSNCLHHECWPEQKQALKNSLEKSKTTVILVSNEVGQGVIPMGALSRQFVDESGWLHQELAELCQHATFVTAGLPQRLK